MDKLFLFTDGSVHPPTRVGFGAFLAIQENDLLSENPVEIKLKRFEGTSSTKLELQALIWALGECPHHQEKIIVYTDSQNIISLKRRRKKLEQNNYLNSRGELLNNHLLYQRFYQIMDKLNCEIIKVQGHLPGKEKDRIDKYFSMVDKASRKALRNNG